jgi:hypothetical protein
MNVRPERARNGKWVVILTLLFMFGFTAFMIVGTKSCAAAMEPVLRERQKAAQP